MPGINDLINSIRKSLGGDKKPSLNNTSAYRTGSGTPVVKTVSSYNGYNDLAVSPKIQNTVQESSPGSRGSNSPAGSIIDNVGDTRSVGYTLDPEGVAAREFQLYMSNTAHQREVADLKAAGLNPVLSANGGANGYSAATGQNTDLAKDQLKNNLIITAMNNNSAQKIANIQSATNLAIAQLNANTSHYVADKNYDGQIAGNGLRFVSSLFSLPFKVYN